jgi:hypothetical protein
MKSVPVNKNNTNLSLKETEKQVPVLSGCPCWSIPEFPLSDFLLTNFFHPEYDWHGQPLNTGTCFSVSSDDRLVLFLFPRIPTGDPAIVASYEGHWYALLKAFVWLLDCLTIGLSDYRSDPLQNSFKISVLSGIFIDYYMTFFISHVQKPNRLLTKERSRTSETRYHRRTNDWQGHTRTQKNTYIYSIKT